MRRWFVCGVLAALIVGGCGGDADDGQPISMWEGVWYADPSSSSMAEMAEDPEVKADAQVRWAFDADEGTCQLDVRFDFREILLPDGEWHQLSDVWASVGLAGTLTVEETRYRMVWGADSVQATVSPAFGDFGMDAGFFELAMREMMVEDPEQAEDTGTWSLSAGGRLTLTDDDGDSFVLTRSKP